MSEGDRDYQKVMLERVELRVGIGAYPEELHAPQRITVDVELVRFGVVYGGSGLGECLNYDRIYRHLRDDWPGRPHTELLEELAEALVRFCLEDARVDRCRVLIRKCDVYGGAGVPAVEVQRSRPVQTRQ